MKFARIVALLVALSCFAGTACTAQESESRPRAATMGKRQLNLQDVNFAITMSRKHTQTLALVDMLRDKPGVDRKIVSMAESLASTREEELTQFTSWLEIWGGKTPEPDGPASEQLQRLQAAAAPGEFGRIWLQVMTKHLRSGLKAMNDEVDHGQSPDVRFLAGTMRKSTRAEIKRLRRLSRG